VVPEASAKNRPVSAPMVPTAGLEEDHAAAAVQSALELFE